MTKASKATARQSTQPRCIEQPTGSSRKSRRRNLPAVNVTLTIEGSDDEVAEAFARMLLDLVTDTKHPD
jgi:hypothetical protein